MNRIDTVYCAAVTPMNRDESIDLGGLMSNIRWQIQQGLGGVLVCGGTGEFVSMTAQERMAVVEAAAREISGQRGFMVGCAAETTKEAISHARHAEENGADGVLLIASYYFKPSRAELIEHMRAVADSVKIPVVLYNNPGSCGSDLTPDVVAEIAKCPNVRHIKEASGELARVRQLLNACPSGFHVMCGCDYLAVDILGQGGDGWVSITANALPGPSQRLLDAMRGGHRDEAQELMDRYAKLYTICEQPYKAVQTVKFMMEALGQAAGPSRLPRLPLTEDERQAVCAMMREAGLAVSL